MKIESNICFMCLVSQTLAAHKSYFSNTSLKARKNGAVRIDNNAYGRTLQILPTLLKKFLGGRRKFDTVDNIIGDFLFGMAPSDSPSMTPSDAPSRAPSDIPSASPTAVPSAAPFSWNDVLGSDSSNFKTCPSNAIPINYATNTELNILYSYKIELESNAHLFKTLEKVETLLEAKLIDDICNTSLDVISFSSSPSDKPGASCGTSTDCYVIAGRFQLMIGVDSIADANSVSCHFLEATRAYIMSGDIVGQISDVVSIESNLVPNFCPYQPALSASQGIDVGTSDRSSMAAKRVVPITIGLLAILVATATILLYARYRTTSTDVALDKCPSSGDSDIEFQNSDETDDFEVDPTATVDAAKHYELTHAKNRRTSPNKTMTGDNSAECGATNSPSPTEQEIVFTPSSSVATSVLFRSP